MQLKHHLKKSLTRIVLSSIYFVLMATVCVFSYVTYAWFSQTRQAEVNFASLNVDKGISFRLKYFTENGTLGYERSLASSYTEEGKGFSYTFGSTSTASFADATLESHTAASYAPGYATSYAIEVTNESSSPKTVALYLTHFSSVASTAYFSDENYQNGIALCEAMRVYTSYVAVTTDSALTSAAAAFLEEASPTNYFSHTSGTPSTGTTLDTPEIWGPETGIALAGQASAVLFVSFYFSNEASTFYSYSATNSDNQDQFYYAHATTGDSNVYRGLSIAFSQLNITIIDF